MSSTSASAFSLGSQDESHSPAPNNRKHARQVLVHKRHQIDIRQGAECAVSVQTWPAPVGDPNGVRTSCSLYPTVVPCNEVAQMTMTCPPSRKPTSDPNEVTGPVPPPGQATSSGPYKHPIVGSDTSPHKGLSEVGKIMLALFGTLCAVVVIHIIIYCCCCRSRRNENTHPSRQRRRRGPRPGAINLRDSLPSTGRGGRRIRDTSSRGPESLPSTSRGGRRIRVPESGESETSEHSTVGSNHSSSLGTGLRRFDVPVEPPAVAIPMPDRFGSYQVGRAAQDGYDRGTPPPQYLEMMEVPAQHAGRGEYWQDQLWYVRQNIEARPEAPEPVHRGGQRVDPRYQPTVEDFADV